ncbi:MAG: aminopeptidase P family N-terminal domain-containing protein, partial [Eubacteriales bacterium]
MNQYNKRIDTLREEMMEHGITIYLILTTDPHQSEYIDPHYQFRTYLTGFTGSNATLLITMNTAVLWTDGRYDVQAKKQLEGTNVELIITSAPN